MAVSARGIYSQTLQAIIAAKLEELVRKRDAFERSKSDTTEAVRFESDSREQLKLLLEGVKACFKISKNSGGSLVSSSAQNSQLFLLLNNLERFCEQPRFDPSISEKMLSKWKASLMQQLDAQSSRYEYASLYARLVTDWLSCEKDMKGTSASNDMEITEDFEELDDSTRMESRLAWEATVFEAANVDAASIKKLLVRLFGQGDGNKKQLYKALEALRHQVAAFESGMARPGNFTEATIGTSIDGLLSGDLINDEKRTVLKDFRRNPVILAELADVLNLRMANGIEEWTWGDIVPLEQRKHVAGQYSVYMHEDMLQAIFLQYIGMKWSVFLKKSLVNFIKTDRAWNAAGVPSSVDTKKRKYYLGRVRTKSSIQSQRLRVWRSRYFITQLPNSENQNHVSKDGGEEAHYSFGKSAPQMHQAMVQASSARHMMQVHAQNTDDVMRKRKRAMVRPSEDEEDEGDDVESDDEATSSLMDLKQGLLHILRTEILINNRLHDGITAFRGQFKNWNSLLPHTTVMMVLTWFGASRKWLKFIETFMQAPLAFMQGDTIEWPRTRRRGVPGSHPLSDVLGEAVLFCLDLAVNQDCDGACLYRICDDFWFWHADEASCIKAWSVVTEFADIMGLSLDLEKSGSSNIRKINTGSAIVSGLPHRPIRWGFLYLDSKTGQFEIDDDMVNRHVEDLKHQLDQKTSEGILAWVQAFNVYANTFFTTNFGKAANCFGRVHTDKVLAVFERVQKQIFNDSNVVDHLRGMLEDRYGIRDVPEGYIFFPAEVGGLELQNPFITLLQSHTPGVDDNPQFQIDRFFKTEAESYLQAKEAFVKGQVKLPLGFSIDCYMPGEKDEFFSFAEYIRHREVYCHGNKSNELGNVYNHLLQTPWERSLEASTQTASALRMMNTDGIIARSSSINGNWPGMTAYWKWVVEVYGPDIVSKFGGLNIVDNGVLPIGMVGLFRSDRVQWKG